MVTLPRKIHQDLNIYNISDIKEIMKTVLISLDDEEYRTLEKVKHDARLTWRDILTKGAEVVRGKKNG